MSIQSVMLFNDLILCCPFSFCLQSFPASGSFPVSLIFVSDGQSVGASTSASVLPINIQGWFLLGLTGWISLQSKGLSIVFSSTTVQKHQFFSIQPSLWPYSRIYDSWKNHSFDYTELCRPRPIKPKPGEPYANPPFYIHFWKKCLCAQSLQSCLTLCDPMGCGLQGSFIHGIL